jgi:hypothetical protein
MGFLDSPINRIPRSRSPISAVSKASRQPIWLFFSRTACSATALNCEAIIGIRNKLQCCLIVASCSWASCWLIAHLLAPVAGHIIPDRKRTLLEKGWTTEGVSDVLGSAPEIIRKHYAQWTAQRQERILSLVQDVWDVRFLSDSKKLSVAAGSKEDKLVDGMGLEPTTPTLRTWCSPS